MTSIKPNRPAQGAVRAVLLDSDGTLIEDMPPSSDPEFVRLAPQAGEGLRLLQTAGYRLFVLSHQPGLARGLFEESALLPPRARVQELLAEYGVEIDGWYCCPHDPSGSVPGYAFACTCRIPAPGLHEAARSHDLDLRASWTVGDMRDDIEAGRRAGTRTVLIDSGKETAWSRMPAREPHFRAANLLGAARAILAADRVAGLGGRQPLRALGGA